MFDVNKLEKEDLIEYIKKLNLLMDRKDRYIEDLEEKVYMEEKLNVLDAEIKDAQQALRMSMARLEVFEETHSEPTIIDLNEDKETDKVKEPKFEIGDVVECSWLTGKYVVCGCNDICYLIRNVEDDCEYTVTGNYLTKVSEEDK